MLVGNKCDMDEQRIITTAQGQELAQRFGGAAGTCLFLESSAKMKINIDKIFTDLIRLINSRTKPVKKSKGLCSLL